MIVNEHTSTRSRRTVFFFAILSIVNIAAFASSTASAASSRNADLLFGMKGGSIAAIEKTSNGTISPTINETATTFSYRSKMDDTIVDGDDSIAGEALSHKLDSTDNRGRALKVLFLSADTGGGHRASAESLANQFLKHFPGTEYDLADVWTPTNVYPYRTLVKSYKHLSAHPLHWKLLYHISNTRPYEILTDVHSTFTCYEKITKQLEKYDPDVVISVHPTMNNVPEKVIRQIAEKRGKYVPFFTVVTDFGSGHCTWFQKGVDKMYIANERIRKLAKKRGSVADEKLVMSGLPIRQDFAVQAKEMGDRTTTEGKEYRKVMKDKLQLDTEKKVVLVMGGGEGVGSLSTITEKLYVQLRAKGVDASICVVCGRNEELREELDKKDWNTVFSNAKNEQGKKTKKLKTLFARKLLKREVSYKDGQSQTTGKIDVVSLGFVTNMAEYMVASDVLVSKAGPGTIAEAAALGLPVMITSFLPGQEAGNVDIVLDGEFGASHKKPKAMAAVVTSWLQDEAKLDEMSLRSAAVGNPNAASNIVEDIGKITLDVLDKNSSRNR